MAFHNTRGRFSKAGPSTRIPGAINFDELDSAPVPLVALGLASTEHEANPLQEEPLHSSTPLQPSTPVQPTTPVHMPTPLIPQVPLPANPTPLTSNPTPLFPPFTSAPPVFPPPLPSLPFICHPAPHQVPQNTAMPPAPAGIDPAMWANNQALILSLLPALQAMYQAPAAAPPAPVSHPKEGDAKAPTPFSGDDPTKL